MPSESGGVARAELCGDQLPISDKGMGLCQLVRDPSTCLEINVTLGDSKSPEYLRTYKFRYPRGVNGKNG